jgi:hypothetical protein
MYVLIRIGTNDSRSNVDSQFADLKEPEPLIKMGLTNEDRKIALRELNLGLNCR